MPSISGAHLRARVPAARDAAVLYRRASLTIAGAAATAYAIFIARTSFSVGGRTYFSLFDDAMISMRYARNLAHGAGLVWNAGQPPVEGYTNFLWTLWMALVHLAGISDSKAALPVMLSGAAILVVNLFVVRAIAETVAPGRRGGALVAMAATAAYYPLAYWTLRGMEVGLVSLLTCAMALYALRLEREFDGRTLAKLAAVSAAAVLTRDDVLVPCLVVLGYLLLRCPGRRKECAGTIAGAIALAIGAHEAFRIAFYGSALPNTYTLKLGGIGLGARLARGSDVLASVAVHALVAPLALAVGGLAIRTRRVPAAVWLLAGIVAADAAYSVYVGGDAWETLGITNRFVTPAVPLLLVLAAVGFARMRERATPRAVRALAAVLGAAGAVHLVAALAAGTLPHVPYMPYAGLSRPDVIQSVGLLLVAGAASVARARGADARLVWPVLAIALVVATAGDQIDGWRSGGAAYADADAAAARLGVHIREGTSDKTKVAVVWAGAIPYFDHRPSIDILGKNDAFIAHESPHAGALYPGHMKWDYAYSVAALRPDVIAQLWRPTPGDFGLLRELRYVPITQDPTGLYVRGDARGVDRRALAHPRD
ncbi:MAG: hypothetical protein JOZ25_09340 [Actinobacteria bacterium]|nr:hypothetical protein [Actinomycetota bacterium]